MAYVYLVQLINAKFVVEIIMFAQSVSMDMDLTRQGVIFVYKVHLSV